MVCELYLNKVVTKKKEREGRKEGGGGREGEGPVRKDQSKHLAPCTRYIIGSQFHFTDEETEAHS